MLRVLLTFSFFLVEGQIWPFVGFTHMPRDKGLLREEEEEEEEGGGGPRI